MAIGFSCGVLHHVACFPTIARCRTSEQFPHKSSSCCGARTTFGVSTSRLVPLQAAKDNRLAPIGNPVGHHRKIIPRGILKIIPRGGRSILYEDATSYVLMEPGEDEQFVTLEELQERLKSWLLKWPAKELPEDLQQFESLDEVVVHLVDSACELNLGGGLGSLQWFEVRLES